MKRSARYLALLLCLSLTFTLFSCFLERPDVGKSDFSDSGGGGIDPSVPLSGTVAPPVSPIPEDLLTVAEKRKSEYQIVYPVGATEDIVSAANDLADRIFDVTGARLPVVHDSMPQRECEILIGDVFRAELMSVKSAYELKNLDYAVCVEGKRVVILGKNEYATYQAIDFFSESVVYENEDAGCFGVKEDFRYIYRSGATHHVTMIDKGETYADFAIGIDSGRPTLFRLTYTGNRGWRIQTRASFSEEFDDVGASQLLSIYLNEEPYLRTDALAAEEKEDAILLSVDDGSIAKVFLDQMKIEFYTPSGETLTVDRIEIKDGSSLIGGDLQNGEGIFGSGERFDSVNQRGRRLEIYALEKWSSSEATYVAIPLFCFSRGIGVFVNRYEYMVSDLGYSDEEHWTVQVKDAPMDCYLFATDNIGDAIYGYTEISGHATQPEEWTYGMIVCRYDPELTQKWSVDITPFADGRRLGVYDMIAKMEAYDLPWSGILVEMWGKYRSPDHNTDLKELCDYVHSIGKKMISYLPVGGISWTMDGYMGSYHLSITLPSGRVTKELPLSTKENVFPDANSEETRTYVDITNPYAMEWYFEEYYNYLTWDIGVDGYKVDFCEQVPDNFTINYYDDYYPSAGSHHWYPTAFCGRLWQEMVEKPDGGMLYIRGGGLGLQRSPYVWGGDQTRDMICQSWLLKATLSMGLSGLPFFSFDMSGYDYRGYNCLTKNVWEEAKVFVRGTAMAAFTICLETHGSVRTAFGFAEEGVPYATDVYRGYVKLHELLTPYFTELAENASKRGMPVMRHMVLGWQDDPNVYDIEDQYTLGDAFLLAPVVTDSNTREVYLPQGQWLDLNTGETIVVGKEGKRMSYHASLAQLPAFFNLETESDTARGLVPGIQELFDYLGSIDVPE